MARYHSHDSASILYHSRPLEMLRSGVVAPDQFTRRSKCNYTYTMPKPFDISADVLVDFKLSFLAHSRMYNCHSSTPYTKIQQWYLLFSSLSYPICPTRSSQYQVPKTTIVIQHTSYLYARNPIKAGKANMYANVILAVRAFHLKYLCLL